MPRPVDPQAKARVLDAAERLFHERGYLSVSMNDIADATGIRKASLYHHAPGGKEELYLEVSERLFGKHRVGLDAAIAGAEVRLEPQLRAVAGWLIAHAPMGLLAMLHNDMPALAPEGAQRLTRALYACMWQPLRDVFAAAAERGEVRALEPDMMVGAFLSLMDGLTYVGTRGGLEGNIHVMAEGTINLLLEGLEPR